MGRIGGLSRTRSLVLLGLSVGIVSALAFGRTLVNGDTLFALAWGRQLAEGGIDSFAGGPTPHPLPNVAGALTWLLGTDAGYTVTWLVFGPLSLGLVATLVFDVARRLAGAWAAVATLPVLLTSSALLANPATARYDVLFAGLVLLAVDLEITRRRHGVLPLVALVAAGLIRPEAWLLAGLYWLWLWPVSSPGRRAGSALLVAAAPVLWTLMDALVTGDPLWSFHVTETGSDAFYRQYTVGENLRQAWQDLGTYTGLIPMVGAGIAVLTVPRRRLREAAPLLVVLAVTGGMFVALTLKGLASSQRYLFLPACCIIVLGCVACAGWARRTRPAVMVAAVLSAFLIFQVLARADGPARLRGDIRPVAQRNADADAVVHRPAVRAMLLGCRHVAVPTVRVTAIFAYFSEREPHRWVSDDKARTRPDVYVAPATREAREAVLKRARFDDDASYTLPPGMRAVATEGAWRVYARPGVACVDRALDR